jgi:predicted tellurium resistance membrane protein TerC
MGDLLTIEAFLTLFMLILLQAVLGFDNLLYIAIESNKVGNAKDAKKVRQLGIGIAVVFRILLLFVIVALFQKMAAPLFSIHLEKFIEGEFTMQSLVTLFGGGFIIYTAIKEIHHLLIVEHIEHTGGIWDAALLQRQ